MATLPPILYLEWGGDLVLDNNGGLQLATGWDAVRQFLERLILTNFETVESDGTLVVAEYIFHHQYGLGTRALIGHLRVPQTIADMSRKIKQAIAQSDLIKRSPEPVVAVTPITHGVQILVDVFPVNVDSGTLALQLTQ